MSNINIFLFLLFFEDLELQRLSKDIVPQRKPNPCLRLKWGARLYRGVEVRKLDPLLHPRYYQRAYKSTLRSVHNGASVVSGIHRYEGRYNATASTAPRSRLPLCLSLSRSNYFELKKTKRAPPSNHHFPSPDPPFSLLLSRVFSDRRRPLRNPSRILDLESNRSLLLQPGTIWGAHGLLSAPADLRSMRFWFRRFRSQVRWYVMLMMVDSGLAVEPGTATDLTPKKERAGNGDYANGGWKSEDGSLTCGYSSFRGKRVSMEDYYDLKSAKIDGQTIYLFGIFDGETYRRTDSDFLAAESNTSRDDGSTASTAVLIGKHLYVANVGDSRAVISKTGKGDFFS
ncbi:hypothetical protein BHM03_00012549 [Ensete ventricosum]|nr:hypothetical protein BHM03_00012549 [Ensete ventricosum]